MFPNTPVLLSVYHSLDSPMTHVILNVCDQRYEKDKRTKTIRVASGLISSLIISEHTQHILLLINLLLSLLILNKYLPAECSAVIEYLLQVNNEDTRTISLTYFNPMFHFDTL